MTSPQTVLITGATSGIGLGLARRLQAQGHRLILTGRRQSRLDDATAGQPGMTGYQNDITDPAQIADLAARMAKDHPDLSTVILNAGIMQVERLGANATPLAIARTIEPGTDLLDAFDAGMNRYRTARSALGDLK